MKPPGPLDLFEQLATIFAPRDDRGTVKVVFQGVRVAAQHAERERERERLRADRARAQAAAERERSLRAARRARAASDGYDPHIPPAELWDGPIPEAAIAAVVRSSRTLRDGALTYERNVRYQK